jgi:hypothetical protein
VHSAATWSSTGQKYIFLQLAVIVRKHCISVGVRLFQPTNQNIIDNVNKLPPGVSYVQGTNYGFLNNVIYQKHAFDFMLHYKTLSCMCIYIYIYVCTIIKPISTHSENVQATHSAGLQEISCGGISSLQWPAFVINYITPSEQKVNNCRLLLKLLCCQKHLVFIKKIDWGTKFPSFSYCSYPFNT